MKTVTPLKTIELMVQQDRTYFITELTEEQKDFIVLQKNQGTLDVASTLLDINCKGILLIGGTSKINTINIGKYIGRFLGPNTGKVSNSNNLTSDRQIHYRDYTMSLEKQRDSAWLLNMCPDIRMSVETLKKVIKADYCCIWREEI